MNSICSKVYHETKAEISYNPKVNIQTYMILGDLQTDPVQRNKPRE